MKYILAKKEEMTQVFDDNGKVYPATVLSAGPVTVTQVKTEKTDKYNAVQVGYGARKEKNVSKAEQGHTGKNGPFANIKEFRVEDADTISGANVGDKIDVSNFEKGDKVVISSVSKGKGFQGVVKRHGFHGGPRSHGQKHSEREPGSIGATGPQRVFKGTKMPGRMGGDKVTHKSVKVLAIDAKNNKLIVSGAVPGRRGTLVQVSG
jgi:large subunit ribosomal protein L3|tara:strand:+ start:23541 stop:24158 length:618 start_codon:yes stop_codon:yes gene_type:complete